MRHYPSYRIEDFYVKSYREGGITHSQFMFLYESAVSHEHDKNKFLAACHGLDLDAAVAGESKNVANSTNEKIKDKPSSPMLFGDPEQYSHLSEEERKSMTQKMLAHWKPMGEKLLEGAKPVYSPN